MGPSGSGKSTLLNLVTGAQPLQSGSIELLDYHYATLSARQLDRLRADHIGIIFQSLNLVPYLNGFDNALLGLQFSKRRSARSPSQTQEVLQISHGLGLSEALLNKPANQLSVGQQQRIAVIRALLGRPELIVADEPTSALDERSTNQFMTELMESFDPSEQAVLMVSHNPLLIPYFDRVLELPG